MSDVRSFVDANGQPWRAYAVEDVPVHGSARRYLPDSYQQGWLVFESARHKFRLAPVPRDWQNCSGCELLAYLGVASHARRSKHVDTSFDTRSEEHGAAG